jgi:sterol desaturase/sphingolipid hydroxylase (fatty acid hydroxylase superfamily)
MPNAELLFWLPMLVLACFEEFHAERKQAFPVRERWINNFSLLLINRYLPLLILPVSVVVFYDNFWHQKIAIFHLSYFDIHPFLAIAFYLVCYDFIQYWVHRLLHKFDLLWRLHRVHHTDSALDISTSVRHHPLEAVLNGGVTISLLILLGASLDTLMWCLFCAQLYAFFSHSNIMVNRVLERPLGIIFVTPNSHAIHHFSERPYTDSNFGEIFSIWDRCFNTHCQPTSITKSKPVFGLDDPQQMKNVSILRILLSPFKT